jgi:hypothetical protein
MRSALAPLRRQARSLQRWLHPRVAQLDLVFIPQFLVKVPHEFPGSPPLC